MQFDDHSTNVHPWLNCKPSSISLPLVSLVVVNRNYARYVGATISSIKDQTYQRFECLVIDNASSDDSAAVISAQIAGDTRFTFKQLSENLGHLGAAISSLNELRGDFLVFVDSDDLLYPDYIASHLQVHLATNYPTAFSSSNVVEINDAGSVIGGGSYPLSNACIRAEQGLRPWSQAARTSVVSEQHHQALLTATRYMPPEALGWFWGPGTSNMYRRSIFVAVTPKLENRPLSGGVDGFYNPILHAMTGTTLIDAPLSAYRIHDANDFTRMPLLARIRSGKKDVELRNLGTVRFAMTSVIDSVIPFTDIITPVRFWPVLDIIAHSHAYWPDVYSHQDIRQAFARNFAKLRELFSERGVLRELRARMPVRDYWRYINQVYGGGVLNIRRLKIIGLEPVHIIGNFRRRALALAKRYYRYIRAHQ